MRASSAEPALPSLQPGSPSAGVAAVGSNSRQSGHNPRGKHSAASCFPQFRQARESVTVSPRPPSQIGVPKLNLPGKQFQFLRSGICSGNHAGFGFGAVMSGSPPLPWLPGVLSRFCSNFMPKRCCRIAILPAVGCPPTSAVAGYCAGKHDGSLRLPSRESLLQDLEELPRDPRSISAIIRSRCCPASSYLFRNQPFENL